MTATRVGGSRRRSPAAARLRRACAGDSTVLAAFLGWSSAADGVRGQPAMGHERNSTAPPGGPHRLLVDKTGTPKGIVFPLAQP